MTDRYQSDHPPTGFLAILRKLIFILQTDMWAIFITGLGATLKIHNNAVYQLCELTINLLHIVTASIHLANTNLIPTL